ncbi:hypothetical protein H4582DRAFT_466726 [Lactarius indigo]|nr:hypothetical protein H4582DRAFT_466726 [Lactarius indigo]
MSGVGRLRFAVNRRWGLFQNTSISPQVLLPSVPGVFRSTPIISILAVCVSILRISLIHRFLRLILRLSRFDFFVPVPHPRYPVARSLRLHPAHYSVQSPSTCHSFPRPSLVSRPYLFSFRFTRRWLLLPQIQYITSLALSLALVSYCFDT